MKDMWGKLVKSVIYFDTVKFKPNKQSHNTFLFCFSNWRNIYIFIYGVRLFVDSMHVDGCSSLYVMSCDGLHTSSDLDRWLLGSTAAPSHPEKEDWTKWLQRYCTTEENKTGSEIGAHLLTPVASVLTLVKLKVILFTPWYQPTWIYV